MRSQSNTGVQVCSPLLLRRFAWLWQHESHWLRIRRSLHHVARNLVGSVGLALIGVFIDRRNTLHADQIAQTVSQNSVIGNEQLAQSAASFAGKGSDAAYVQF